MASAERKFEEELTRALSKFGVTIESTNKDGTINIDLKGIPAIINPENVRRNYLIDNDPAVIEEWAQTICSMVDEPADWEDAKNSIMFLAKGGDDLMDEVLDDPISGELHRVLVWCAPDEARIRWLVPSHLENWKISRDEAIAAASHNMNMLLNACPLELAEVGPHKLGMLLTESVFKASLIFSPTFKQAISEALGWPVFVVIPCRDFLYITPDRDLVGKFGKVVLDEYQQSGYPISTEVYMISDDGIKAIGNYKPKA